MQRDLAGKVIIVTGANSGIGFVSAKNFARRGARVVLVCRNRQRGEEALKQMKDLGTAKLKIADMSLMHSVVKLAKELLGEFSSIDVLCNNAGLASATRTVTSEGFETILATNHLGGYLLSRMLLPALLNAAEQGEARVLFTSSYGHNNSPLDFADLGLESGYTTLRAYGRSKLMNLLTARELHTRYGDKGLVCSSFHPGAVRTPIWGKSGAFATALGMLMYPFMISEDKGADTMIWLAASNEQAARTAEGKYFFRRQRWKIAAFATDEDASKLWQCSEDLLAGYLSG